MEGLGFLVLMTLLIGLYFTPALVAGARHHPQQGAILALNLLAGWTFIGWVGAFVWACTNVGPRQEPPPAPQWHWAPGAEARSLALAPPEDVPLDLPYPDNAWRTFWLGLLYVLCVLGAVTFLIYLIGSTL